VSEKEGENRKGEEGEFVRLLISLRDANLKLRL